MKTPADHPAIDKVLLLMVSGMSTEDLANACVSRLGVEPHEVAAITTEARRRLTRAADYNRDEQLGTAMTRMNDIYARAIRAGDIKTALTAQREINKLLDLYREAGEELGSQDAPDAETNTTRLELAAIRDHLMPLGLAGENYPLREHARIAADLIRDQRNCLSETPNAPTGEQS